MSATIEVDGKTATVTGGVWKADDPVFQQYLTAVAGPFEANRSAFYIPDMDYACASIAAGQAGGRITKHDPPNVPEGTP